MKISIVIPLYNSEKTIAPVVRELQETFPKIPNKEFEIVLVNDCSADDVLSVAKRLAVEDKRIRVLSFAKNKGQATAMLAGYTYATGEYIINMDDDMQHPGYEIGKLIDTLEEGDYDVVFAKYTEQKESWFRRMGSNINCKMAEHMAGKPKNIRSNSFFIMRRFIRDEIIKYQNGNPYIYGIIFAATSKIANVETEHRERAVGRSGQTLGKLLGLWLNGFLNFSIKPLRASTALGFLIAGISLIIAIILIVIRLGNPNVPLGWTSTILAIMFFAGVQLVCIGVVGEYLGRMYISASKLPIYVIREKIGFEDEKRKVKEEE